MTVELLKLIVQPVLIERDEDGAIVGERIWDPVPVYTAEQLQAYFDGVLALVEQTNNGGTGAA